ncbi:hypothetical protein GGF32_001034 [Allomyces javanicus]|nr:hypothetical protein GGF32_001034 [Allomyces javanicus]
MNSLKQELVQWHEACQAYDNGDYETALDLFNPILDSSRILFNVGMTFLSMGQPEDAALAFDDAIEHDHYLAAAQFQLGATHYLLGQYSEAEALFQAALDSTRGNLIIDYRQLGLDFRLYACEILFNQALAFAQLGETVAANLLLENARKGARTQEHEERIRAGVDHDGAEPFQVPLKCLFRPPAAKLSNMSKTRFVGHSKVVAAVRSDDRDLDAMKRLSIVLHVKVHFGDTRMLLLPTDATFADLVQAIRAKFQTQAALRPMFRDMDGELVTMTDDDDIAYTRHLAADPNRIHIWCEEL